MTTMRRLGPIIVIDFFATAASVWLAFFLRYEGNLPGQSLPMAASLVYAAVSIPLYMTFGLYRPLWRYSIMGDYLRILPAVTAASLPLLLVRLFNLVIVPYGVIGINWLVTIFFVGGARAAIRLQPELHQRRRGGANVLIVGAGEAGANIARELRTTERLQESYHPIGFIDDDPAKKNMRLSGLKVLGGRSEIAHLVREHEVKEIFIAMPSAPRHAIREIVLACREAAVPAKILPGLFQLIDGQVSVKALRDVAIEDLLPRPPVTIDLDEMASYLRGETVLVTGAGGSIGSELCRQIVRFNPRRLLLLGRGENSIYEIFQELIGLRMEAGGAGPGQEQETEIVPLIADVRDRERLQYLFERYRPSIVFHAAAHKHVPLMEDAPGEAVKNNIHGTLNAAELAHAHQAKSFVLVSTDKAVKPASVMGATKRVAELIVQDLAARSRTRFCAVRFGNVLGSRGSVVPLFQQQIAKGGPVTITDARMTRYFMTIPEAVSLVIQAGAMGRGGEIFVLDMGEPVKIVDLARELIRLCGFEPEKDVKIVETGIRPGEKLFEEILTAEEGVTATRNERIFVAKPRAIPAPDFAVALAELLAAAGEPAVCVERLMGLVPRPSVLQGGMAAGGKR